MRLSGKNALITGGAGAIGSEVARRFLEEGALVVIADNNNERLEKVLKNLNKFGVIKGVQVDVTDENSIVGMVKEVSDNLIEGNIDILLNIAGIAPFSRFEETSSEDFDIVLKVNLRGTFLVSRSVSKIMKLNGGGVIINMSSTNGVLAEEGLSAYNASKAGVILLSKTMALELAKYKIRVNSVCPGFIKTSLQEVGNMPKNVIENYVKKIPIGRLGTPLDVANACIYLASDESSFVTGTEIILDGGQTCQE